ncbi:hypothetical protein [Roseibium sp. M-1]
MKDASAHSQAPLHIVICGSMAALQEMEHMADFLRAEGYRVSTPVREESGFNWEALSLEEAIARKRDFLSGYFATIAKGDVVLIVNAEKHGINGYVGANTLMEAACGHALGKPVYYLYPIGDQACRLEAAAVAAGILEGDINRLPGLLASRCRHQGQEKRPG